MDDYPANATLDYDSLDYRDIRAKVVSGEYSAANVLAKLATIPGDRRRERTRQLTGHFSMVRDALLAAPQPMEVYGYVPIPVPVASVSEEERTALLTVVESILTALREQPH